MTYFVRQQLQQLEDKQQMENGNAIIEVFCAVDEWGKKKFINEAVRSVEVQRLLDSSNTYQEGSIEVEKLDKSIRQNLIFKQQRRQIFSY